MKRIVGIVLLFAYSMIMPMNRQKLLKKETPEKPTQVLEQFLPTVLIKIVEGYYSPVWSKNVRYKVSDRFKDIGYQQLSADGSRLMLTSPSTVAVYNVTTGKQLVRTEQRGHNRCDLRPDGLALLTISDCGRLAEIDLSGTGPYCNCDMMINWSDVNCAYYSADGKRIGSIGRQSDEQPTLRIFDTHSFAVLASLKLVMTGISLMKAKRIPMTFSFNDKLVAVASGGDIHLLSVDALSIKKILPSGPADINSMRFNQSSTRLLSASDSGATCSWDCETGNLLWTCQHPDRVLCADFGLHDAWIATAADDGYMRSIGVESGVITGRFSENKGGAFVISCDKSTMVRCNGPCADIFFVNERNATQEQSETCCCIQ